MYNDGLIEELAERRNTKKESKDSNVDDEQIMDNNDKMIKELEQMLKRVEELQDKLHEEDNKDKLREELEQMINRVEELYDKFQEEDNKDKLGEELEPILNGIGELHNKFHEDMTDKTDDSCSPNAECMTKTKNNPSWISKCGAFRLTYTYIDIGQPEIVYRQEQYSTSIYFDIEILENQKTPENIERFQVGTHGYYNDNYDICTVTDIEFKLDLGWSLLLKVLDNYDVDCGPDIEIRKCVYNEENENV